MLSHIQVLTITCMIFVELLRLFFNICVSFLGQWIWRPQATCCWYPRQKQRWCLFTGPSRRLWGWCGMFQFIFFFLFFHLFTCWFIFFLNSAVNWFLSPPHTRMMVMNLRTLALEVVTSLETRGRLSSRVIKHSPTWIGMKIKLTTYLFLKK